MKKSRLLNAVMIGLMSTAGASVFISTHARADDGECHGMNACKGQGDCGSKDYSCAGNNSCKGQGWKKMSEEDCKKAKGTFVSHGAPAEKNAVKKN